MTGHLFITRGDLLHLHCDAILIPSGTDAMGRYGHLVSPWRAIPGLPVDATDCLRTAPTDEERAVEVIAGSESKRAVWAAHSGDLGKPPAWYAEPYEAFIATAAGRCTVPGEMLGAARPLLGVPLLGTGHGGKRHERGQVMEVVIGRLMDILGNDAIHADVVLVTNDENSYCAAQAARANWIRASNTADVLSDIEHETVERLTREAKAGRLVLFLGAGVSIGAGLPSWNKLLTNLADKTDLSSAERAQLETLDPRDAAAVIERRLEGGEAPEGGGLRAAIEQIVDRDPLRVSLLHQLLAALPSTEVLTTNYDRLFEQAWEDAEREPTVVPKDLGEEGPAGTGRAEWIVKLHGSVDDKSGRPLVLSRGDYLRFETSGAALAGIVQAMFLMRHLLFVGYSLSDDNLHRIVHQVHETIATAAYPRGHMGKFGTVLTDQEPRLQDKIWEDELTFLSTHTGGGDTDAIRRVAIILDELAAATAPQGRYLEDPSFDAMLNDEEIAVREHLHALRKATHAPGVGVAIRTAIEGALSAFGLARDDLFPTTRYESLTIASGRHIEIGVVEHEFQEWRGTPPACSYGRKPAVEFAGQGVFAEIVIVRLCQQAGWDALWASTYGGLRYFDQQPLADRSNTATAPGHLDKMVHRIAEAKDGKVAGTFDVIAWRGDEFRFIEAKRSGRDRVRETQIQWLAAALDLGFDIGDFMLFEWRLKH